MKTLFFSVAVFSIFIYYCSAQGLTLETLLNRASALEANATAEIAVLRAANRTAAANELAREERLIRELVEEIEGLNATAPEAELLRLERRLAEREAVLRAELRLLEILANGGTTGGARLKRQAPTLETLLARAATLEANATAEVAALRAANRTADATELAARERAIQQLVAEIGRVNATATAAELTRLETRLQEEERALAEDLRRLSQPTTPTGNTTLETLLARATTLEANATAEIAALRAANRTAAATELAVEERAIRELVTEIQGLSATAPEAELRRLETRLAERETALRAELRRLENPTTGGTTGGARLRR